MWDKNKFLYNRELTSVFASIQNVFNSVATIRNIMTCSMCGNYLYS